MIEIVHAAFRKLHSYVLIFLVLLISSACSPQKILSSPSNLDNSQATSAQNEQPTAASQPVTGLGLNIPPTRNFSIQNANTTTPEDVLSEVGYGGFGGPGPCDFYEGSPAIAETTPNEADWLEPILIDVCGFQINTNISVTLQTPDGRVLKDSGSMYEYYPTIDSPIGKYRFTFSDGNTEVDFDIMVSMPNESRMFYLENDKVYYLYGLSPNERVRFFQYANSMERGMTAVFVGWQEYYADENGQLMVKLSRDREAFYIPVGDLSGEIPSVLLPYGEVATLGILNPTSTTVITVCLGTKPTRLLIGMNAEVTRSGMAPQLALRDLPSLSAQKVHVIAAGRKMTILKGPECADSSYWWYIRSEQGFEGWAREGDNEDYWIDPLP